MIVPLKFQDFCCRPFPAVACGRRAVGCVSLEGPQAARFLPGSQHAERRGLH